MKKTILLGAVAIAFLAGNVVADADADDASKPHGKLLKHHRAATASPGVVAPTATDIAAAGPAAIGAAAGAGPCGLDAAEAETYKAYEFLLGGGPGDDDACKEGNESFQSRVSALLHVAPTDASELITQLDSTKDGSIEAKELATGLFAAIRHFYVAHPQTVDDIIPGEATDVEELSAQRVQDILEYSLWLRGGEVAALHTEILNGTPEAAGAAPTAKREEIVAALAEEPAAAPAASAPEATPEATPGAVTTSDANAGAVTTPEANAGAVTTPEVNAGAPAATGGAAGATTTATTTPTSQFRRKSAPKGTM